MRTVLTEAQKVATYRVIKFAFTLGVVCTVTGAHLLAGWGGGLLAVGLIFLGYSAVVLFISET